jgi:hypothetical protein
MPNLEPATIGYAIAGLSIGVVIGIGIWIGRAAKESDSFLSGKGATWPVIGFAMMAAHLSAWGGAREAAPEEGWAIAPPADDDFFPWPGIFPGAFFLGFYPLGGEPQGPGDPLVAAATAIYFL